MKSRQTQPEPHPALTPVEPSGIDPLRDRRLREIAVSEVSRDHRFESEKALYEEHLPLAPPASGSRFLHVDDVSVVARIEKIPGLRYYAGRAFVRAGEGDWVAAAFPAIPGYPEYLEERLLLGRSRFMRVREIEKAPLRILESLLHDEDVLGRLAADIRRFKGDFWVHPYMGHPGPWETAKALTERAGRAVRVLAPLPVMTEKANNKVWFAQAVRKVLGERSALRSLSGATPREIARALVELAKQAKRIVIRLADSASGMGTDILDASFTTRQGRELEAWVSLWLDENDWRPGSPAVSLECWEEETLGSPSVQLWIPPLSSGPPLLEGIFDQLFYPDQENVFLGSVGSRLPAPLKSRIGRQGLEIGRFFQHMGYVGRCSFDTILRGSDLSRAEVVFTECNGRWGGTSTPMTFMNRLFGDYRLQPYWCRDFDHPKLLGCPFDELARKLDDILYNHVNGKGWAIIYNVGCLEPVGKLDVITLGQDFEEAESRQREFAALVESRF